MPRLRLIASVAVLVLAGCGAGSGDDSSRQVVASFYPLEYAAQQVGGTVDVTNLTPPGAEPHDIELTARDVARTQEADVVLYVDSEFQPAVEDAVRGARGTAIDLLEGVQLRNAPDEEKRADPHIWLDPVLYAGVVREIGRALAAGKRVDTMTTRLHRLDREFREGISSCERREIVTSHAAFGYLAARYGLRQVPIAGVSPEAEPTPRALESAVRRVRQSGATTVFFETLVSPRVAETVARETGARTAVLNPIEGLTKDQAAHGDDYFTIMRRNLAALRSALGCR
ncbi:MAG TPA: metal ABC transporter substrate-binding protein [Gaiellaceae bacterium]|nr:metal ABC transporter substrate-binding protein [Gaiellaceae bacterium]